MVINEHIAYFREIFNIPGMISEPFLTLGHQEIASDVPPDFQYKDLTGFLASKGLKEVKTLDLFDHRADLKYDLNLPVSVSEHEAYNVVFDIGTLEHLFDTKQCLENCLKMVKLDGLYFLHTSVNGYHKHGLHVFNPEGLIDAIELNGFEILYLKYSTKLGSLVTDPGVGGDILIWLVAKRIKMIEGFRSPQQRSWDLEYSRPPIDGRIHRPSVTQGRRSSLTKGRFKGLVLMFLLPVWKVLLRLKDKIKRSLED